MSDSRGGHSFKPLWSILRSREEYGRPHSPLLTVTSESGVGVRDLADGRSPSDDLSQYKVVCKDDLVVNKMWARFGAYGVSQFDGIISPAYWVLEIDPLAFVPRYLHYLLRSRPYRSEVWRRSKDLPPNGFDLPWDQFRAILVPGVSLIMQRAIADFLDAETARIDALETKKRALVRTLADRRTAVTLLGVGGRLTGDSRRVPSRVAWLDDRPAHWGEVLVRLVALLGTGHTPSRNHPEWWADCTIPWITTGEVAQLRSDRAEFITETREKISTKGLANSSAVIHPKDTVVLCRTASAGYSAIMGVDMATSQDFVTWTCGEHLRPRFLLLCLRAMRQDLLGRLAMGSTHQTIYMPDIQAIRVPLPPVAEQDQIVDETWKRLHAVDAAADRLAHQIRLLEEHRRALITAAVTGQLDIPGVSAA